MGKERTFPVKYMDQGILLKRKMDMVAELWRNRATLRGIDKDTQDNVLIQWRDGDVALLIPSEKWRQLAESYGG